MTKSRILCLRWRSLLTHTYWSWFYSTARLWCSKATVKSWNCVARLRFLTLIGSHNPTIQCLAGALLSLEVHIMTKGQSVEWSYRLVARHSVTTYETCSRTSRKVKNTYITNCSRIRPIKARTPVAWSSIICRSLTSVEYMILWVRKEAVRMVSQVRFLLSLIL